MRVTAGDGVLAQTGRHRGSETQLLVCQAGRRAVAIPLEDVIETMRPLPVQSLPGMPSYIRGVSVIRGAPTPVADIAELLSEPSATTRRFVTIRREGRTLAAAVSDVNGVRAVATGDLAGLPPLLGMGPGVISGLAHLDDEMLVVLAGARLIPDRVWSTLTAARESDHEQVTAP